MRGRAIVRIGRCAPVALLLCAAGCDRDADAAQGDASSDPGIRWSVAPAPELRIGGDDGKGALHRVMAALRLPDGSVAVANGGSQQVRIVAPDGRLLRTIGRKGGGPGEFQLPSWLGLRGDTLIVADILASRISRFALDGTYLGSVQIAPEAGHFPQIVGQYAHGTVLVAADEAAGGQKGVIRGRTALLRLRRDGTLRATLAVVPSSDQFASVSDNGTRFKTQSLPFGRRTVFALRGDVLYVGIGETPAIQAIDTAGRSRDALRTTFRPRPVGAADIDEYWKKLVTIGGDPDDRGPPEGIEYPTTLPPYSSVNVDQLGRIWVGESRFPREWDGPANVQIFSPGGHPLARIQLPPHSLLMDAGSDWILVREMDANEREMVSVYRYSAAS